MAKGLGRGLGALIKENSIIEDVVATAPNGLVSELKIVDVEPNKEQPRKEFDEEALESLCESIKEHGVIQPILVIKSNGGFYKIIAGERRWRAAKMAGLKKIPAIIKEYDDVKAYEVSLIENLQREDLNPIEESLGYKKLIDEFSLTQEQIAKRVSKSRSAIANSLRLLTLPDEVVRLIEDKKISTGHAKVLLSASDKKFIVETAKLVVEKQISVRELEKIIKLEGRPRPKEKKEDLNLKLAILELEKTASELIGSKVKISGGKNKGKIEIEYYGNDDLERIINLLKK